MRQPIRRRQLRWLYMASPQGAFRLSVVLLALGCALLYTAMARLHQVLPAFIAGAACALLTMAVLVYGTICDVQATAARANSAPDREEVL